jgi:hypothetical protein
VRHRKLAVLALCCGIFRVQFASACSSCTAAAAVIHDISHNLQQYFSAFSNYHVVSSIIRYQDLAKQCSESNFALLKSVSEFKTLLEDISFFRIAPRRRCRIMGTEPYLPYKPEESIFARLVKFNDDIVSLVDYIVSEVSYNDGIAEAELLGLVQDYDPTAEDVFPLMNVGTDAVPLTIFPPLLTDKIRATFAKIQNEITKKVGVDNDAGPTLSFFDEINFIPLRLHLTSQCALFLETSLLLKTFSDLFNRFAETNTGSGLFGLCDTYTAQEKADTQIAKKSAQERQIAKILRNFGDVLFDICEVYWEIIFAYEQMRLTAIQETAYEVAVSNSRKTIHTENGELIGFVDDDFEHIFLENKSAEDQQTRNWDLFACHVAWDPKMMKRVLNPARLPVFLGLAEFENQGGVQSGQNLLDKTTTPRAPIVCPKFLRGKLAPIPYIVKIKDLMIQSEKHVSKSEAIMKQIRSQY